MGISQSESTDKIDTGNCKQIHTVGLDKYPGTRGLGRADQLPGYTGSAVAQW